MVIMPPGNYVANQLTFRARIHYSQHVGKGFDLNF
jgi:hypothetical protein